jgi:2-oxoglutarate dehydrogenase E2 component (dihydrolipoamide succinyltransferase)
MSTSVVLPALGESVTEGTVTRWLKQVGDTVQEDEGLLEISTDKVDTEIPSPVSGVIEEILVQEDETVEVGAILAKIGDGSGSAPADDAPAAAPAEETPSPAEEAPAEPAAETAPAAPAPTAQPVPEAPSDATEVKLPELGESVTEGTITRWLKAVGDDVAVDEPLLEISTDKVDTEIPSPVAGTLQEILVQEDETVAVGSALARIGSGAAAPTQAQPAPAVEEEIQHPQPSEVQEQPAAPAEEKHAEQPAPAAQPAAAPPQVAEPSASATSGDEITYVTPLVRRLAQQQGVDLATVTGSGVGGRIRKEDVLKAAEAAKSAPAAAAPAAPAAAAPAAPVEVSPLRGTTQKMSRLRKVIAERAVASMQATAQLTTVVEVDVTKVAALRDRVKGEFQQKTGDKLSFLPFFALAAVEALKTYPIVNSTVEGDEIVYPAHENVSIAVDTERGLLTPVVKDAGEKNIAQLAREIADLAARTRDNKLKPDELAGGTFTLTNTGSRGALFDTPIVFLPQSAILGLGAVVKKPGVVSVDGKDAISVRSYVYLALSYDHRIIDGADAARFLGAVKARLEAAQFEGDLGI